MKQEQENGNRRNESTEKIEIAEPINQSNNPLRWRS